MRPSAETIHQHDGDSAAVRLEHQEGEGVLSRPGTPRTVGRSWCSLFAAWFPGGATYLARDPCLARRAEWLNARRLAPSFLRLVRRLTLKCPCLLLPQ
jgi:hypothetical protein